MKQILDLLGIGKGKNVIEQISAIIRIVQALISAVQHFNERLSALETGQPVVAAPASPAAAADLSALETAAQAAASF